eukprot:3879889-Amphidinium_carterae.1
MIFTKKALPAVSVSTLVFEGHEQTRVSAQYICFFGLECQLFGEWASGAFAVSYGRYKASNMVSLSISSLATMRLHARLFLASSRHQESN